MTGPSTAATGRGVTVCIIDSGVEADASGPRPAACASGSRSSSTDGEPDVVTDDAGDLFGHGTACGGIIVGLAPDVEIVSVRVLGSDLKGRGAAFLAGLEWAIDQGVDVINLSLSSKSEALYADFHEVVDRAYFAGITLVSAANNAPGVSYPSLFSSVISVAAHEEARPLALVLQPAAAGRVRGVGRERAHRLEGRWLHGRDRQLLRGTARQRPGRPAALAAPGPHALRDQGRAGGDRRPAVPGCGWFSRPG